MGIGRAFALGVDRLIEPVEGMHAAISGRWFDLMGPHSRRLKPSYDTVTKLVYGSVRLGAVAVGAGIDRVVSVEQSTVDAIQSWTNGLFGDGLGRHEPHLATSMRACLQEGEPVTGRLVVLVHGLGRTESCWEGNENGPGLAHALGENAKLTSVPIRYNTGLPVADNGAELSALLDVLVSDWPVPVESIALVGHSMGGLVIGEAMVSGRSGDQGWVDVVTDVVAIATPYRGAPLEKLVVAIERGLRVTKTTRPLAGFLDGRSKGIKDLGFTPHQSENVVPSGVRHHLIAGVATSDPRHPMGSLIGDLMVRSVSSTGPRGAVPESTVVLGGVTHFNILHSSVLIDQVMTWLAPDG